MRNLPLVALYALLSCPFVGTGCSDPVDDARKADTIEAWNTYLAMPEATGSNKIEGEGRLEQLMTAKADTEKTIADYDAVIKRFPKTRNLKKLQKARTDLALTEAEATNTPEGWQKFMTENPTADGAVVKDAKNRIVMAAYGPKLTWTPLKIEQVNLAENPKGPKDGWGFSADVTNGGDKTISYLNVSLQIIDPSGAATNPIQMPAVAPTYKTPMPDTFYKPIAPGETRHWDYETGDVPPGFTDKPDAKITPITITFAADH